jgi:glyoxylase-like metal-dependent hydrolase (beta-lactamase superfamily II)
MGTVNTPEVCCEIFPGVYKFVLPLFGEKPGPVNSYLFTGKNMTLIDTGTIQTVDLLEKGFEKFGFKFSDLDRIIFTHGHIDHYGGALRIIKKAGKKMICLAGSVPHRFEDPDQLFFFPIPLSIFSIPDWY